MDKLDIAKWATDYALQQGASQTAVRVNNSRSVSVEVRDKKIETLKETTENNLTISIYLDHKFSGHSSNDLRKESLKKLIDEGIAATKYLSPDEFRELPDPELYPSDKDKDLKLVDKQYEKLDTATRIEIAKEIESIAVSQSDKIISAKGSFSDSHYASALVLSNGFEGTSEATYYSISAGVTARDSDARPEDYAWASSRYFGSLPSYIDVGKNAAERALRKIGQQKIASGKFDMIVENRTAGRLVSMLISPLSARSLQQKSSFLEGKLDTSIASDKLTIIDDPFIQGAMGSRLYDGDGIAAKKQIIIENGILRNYYIDNYYGKKLGMKTTASGTSNLVFAYGDQSLEEMIATVDRGIFVTSFNGGNSNPTTGDFSLGIGGILIEKGKLTIPVYEMNITGNALDFWNRLVAMGNDVFMMSSWQTASMLFEGIDFSGS